MTFEKALKIKDEFSEEVSSKLYRVCPNPKTDFKGYNEYLVALQELKNLTDEDAKKYSTNSDFEILEGNKF